MWVNQSTFTAFNTLQNVSPRFVDTLGVSPNKIGVSVRH